MVNGRKDYFPKRSDLLKVAPNEIESSLVKQLVIKDQWTSRWRVELLVDYEALIIPDDIFARNVRR